MRITKVITFFTVLLISMSGFAEKVTVFKELLKPSRIYLDHDRIFITERTKVNIYSLKDYKLIGTFGQKGEGPGEFRIPFYIHPLKDRLMIDTPGKISYFTKDGKLIGEVKSKSDC